MGDRQPVPVERHNDVSARSVNGTVTG